MEKPIKVLLVVHRFYDTREKEFGGTTREFYAIVNAFKKSKDIQITVCSDFDISKISKYREEYDVIHCEDNNNLKKMLKAGIIPDVIGPTAKSPAKNKKAWKTWEAEGINPDDYFKAIVIRNNNAEERYKDYDKKIRYIKLGVNTDELKFSKHNPKRYIMWAGDVCREAKNFGMFMKIMKITKLPKGYDWRVMSGYTLDHYLESLRHTALLINTSKNETFCFAMFEANSLGVPSIYPKGLHNPKNHNNSLKFHPDKTIQVNYKPEAYKNMILKVLKSPELYESYRKEARDYTVKNASFQSIRDSFGAVYSEVYRRKHIKT